MGRFGGRRRINHQHLVAAAAQGSNERNEWAQVAVACRGGHQYAHEAEPYLSETLDVRSMAKDRREVLSNVGGRDDRSKSISLRVG
jgi:hypothetical protein